MPWTKIDDSFYDHPKLDRLPPELRNAAAGLWLRALSWSSRFLTDGHIPADRIRKLDGDEPTAEALIDAGFFDRDHDDGYRIHDYLDYNPSADEARRRQIELRERGRRGGQRSAEARARAELERSETLQPVGAAGRYSGSVQPVAAAERYSQTVYPSRPVPSRTKNPPVAPPPTVPEGDDGPSSKDRDDQDESRPGPDHVVAASPPHSDHMVTTSPVPTRPVPTRPVPTRPDPSRPDASAAPPPAPALESSPAVPPPAAQEWPSSKDRDDQDEGDRWADAGPEWDAFREAWDDRGFPALTSAQRDILWPIVNARPTDAARWVREAPIRLKAHAVVAFALRHWRRFQAGVSKDDPEWIRAAGPPASFEPVAAILQSDLAGPARGEAIDLEDDHPRSAWDTSD